MGNTKFTCTPFMTWSGLLPAHRIAQLLGPTEHLRLPSPILAYRLCSAQTISRPLLPSHFLTKRSLLVVVVVELALEQDYFSLDQRER